MAGDSLTTATPVVIGSYPEYLETATNRTSAWWSYSPAVVGSLLITITTDWSMGGTAVTMNLFTGPKNATSQGQLTQVASNTSTINWSVSSSTDEFYLFVYSDVYGGYPLSLTYHLDFIGSTTDPVSTPGTSPIALVPSQITINPLVVTTSAGSTDAVSLTVSTVTASALTVIASPVSTVAILPTEITVNALAVTASPGYIPPTAIVDIGPGTDVWVDRMLVDPSSVMFALTDPDDEAVVPFARPEFVVGVQDPDDGDYQVELQIADNTDFTDAHDIIADVVYTDGGLTYTPDFDIPATTYWRARLLHNGPVLIPWSDTFSVSVDVTVSAATLPVSWTPAADLTAPVHLWHIEPPGAEPGDSVTIYGTGFGATPVVTILDSTAEVTRSELVAAIEAGELRVIDGDVVDPEHWEIDMVVPDVEEPGGPVQVEA